ncbi:MAG TPA: FMN-binding protein [Firmicutes bacterium]|nr:FMN-binding protein [Bacillota bacterium]
MRKSRWFKVLLGVVGVFLLVVVGTFSYLMRGLDAGMQVTVAEPDLSRLVDGAYLGEYQAGRWSNQVQVTVEQHRITDIQVVKDVTFSRPEWTEQLIAAVLGKQTLQVDAVSGATVTTKAYLKAIENALTQ